MPTLGILSSHEVFCGNAAYTKALQEGLSARFGTEYDVRVIALDSEFLYGASDPLSLEQAREHIQEVAAAAAQVDYLNVQLELALYGARPGAAYRRFMTVLEACRPGRFSVTMHRVDTEMWASLLAWRIWRLLFTLHPRAFMGQLLLQYGDCALGGIYRSIVRCVHARGGRFIVHTPRETKNLRRICRDVDVVDHPLRFTEEAELNRAKASFRREAFLERHGLDADSKLVGVFGFLSDYKGFDTVIEALALLPPSYTMCVFGGTHPFTLKTEKHGNPYIGHLRNLITRLDDAAARVERGSDPRPSRRLADRVKFFGCVSDEEMVEGLMACDHTVLPYHEVGQSGSAVAALALEYGNNVLFSRNLAFAQLAKYAGASFESFDIGNANELARKLLLRDTTAGGAPCARRQQFLTEWSFGRVLDLYAVALGIPPGQR